MLLQPLRWLLWIVGRLIVGLRYKVTHRGVPEALQKPGPYLVMPNHPGFCDPMNVLLHFWPYFKFRPVVNEINFKNPFLGPIGWLLRTINLPDMEHTSADAFKRATAGVEVIKEALLKGENVILWPSGRLQRDGVERMGGARAVTDLMAAVPNLTVVLIRTRGVWGSSWSWADGPIPPLFPLLFKSIGRLLGNLIFFAPRRKLDMTVEAFTTAERPAPKRDEVNRWLEDWYNADVKDRHAKGIDTQWPGEVPTFVPYHFAFGPRTHEFKPPYTEPDIDLSKVTPEVKKQVAEMVGEQIKRPLTEDENQPGTSFLQLGIDSLDGMELALHVEQRFGFRGDGVPQKLGQLWAIAIGATSAAPAKSVPSEWFDPPSDVEEVTLLGDTIPEAFVNRCLKHPKDTAAADDLSGVLSYGRLFLGAVLMARRFSKFPEKNIGLMLPASVGGDLALMALHLAGKLPVILNWTTGPNNIAHAVQLMKLQRVVTSKAFIDRAHLEVPGTEFVYLELVRKSVGKREALSALAQMKLFPSAAKRAALKLVNTDPHRPAVVLFTSGSEKAPKAVPLTHDNILANLRGIMPVLKFTRSDSVLGFLPLFHSFGHTVTGLFPLLVGFKVLHHPDPTDANGLVRKIASYKPTITAGTPTFMNFILEKSKPGELDSLRILVVGAEKCPDAVFEKAKQLAPNATIVEGYGITECSPIIAHNPPKATRQGTIGKPCINLDIKLVNVDTKQEVPNGELGTLLVRGPSVFGGYVDPESGDPFETIDGQKWYNTGDLVKIDADGYIHFQGRLKRFLKAGGEMISLPALEEPLAIKYPPTDSGPRVAVEGIETPTGRKVVLFTTEEITLRDANALLMDSGFRGVMRLDAVEKIDAIPVLGTGKTDYKVLRARIEAEHPQ
jgi:acyl-CoA synthetase (AMP-forming)/AMP-acid ligase II/1-acyl-sn-glycerol-3-phosphate acyltransferase/acyl carrier protein